MLSNTDIIAKTEESINENLPVIKGTGEILSDKSATGRERPWNERKKDNVKMAKLFERAREIDEYVISDAALERLEGCGNYLEFDEYEDGSKKLALAYFCRHRFCPVCIWRRAMKMFAQISKVTDRILEKQSVRFIFVTLTQVNCKGEELSETIDRMNKGFLYVAGKSRTFAAADKFKKSMLGYVKAIEVTYNSERDDYHPHIHAIFAVAPSYFGKDYMKKSEWSALWRDAMGIDYMPQVDVRVISTTAAAVAETAKYPIKPNDILQTEIEDLQVNALITMNFAMKKRQLITFGGIFRTVKRELKLDDIEKGDLVHVDDDTIRKCNPIARQIFRFNFKHGLYIN